MSDGLIQILSRTFEQRRAKNTRYSLRAFARSLNLDSSTLSGIMAGRRKVSPKQAVRLLQKIGINDADFQIRVLAPLVGVDLPRPPDYSEMNLDLLNLVRDWEHHAILAAFDIDATLTPERLAEYFDVPLERIHKALERLQTAGLLQNENGAWRSLQPRHAFIPRIANADVAEGHRQHLEKAAHSLANHPIDRRDITGTTFRFNPEKMEAARELARDFRRRMASLAEDGASEVYRLNVQLFPLGKGALK